MKRELHHETRDEQRARHRTELVADRVLQEAQRIRQGIETEAVLRDSAALAEESEAAAADELADNDALEAVNETARQEAQAERPAILSAFREAHPKLSGAELATEFEKHFRQHTDARIESAQHKHHEKRRAEREARDREQATETKTPAAKPRGRGRRQ